MPFYATNALTFYPKRERKRGAVSHVRKSKRQEPRTNCLLEACPGPQPPLSFVDRRGRMNIVWRVACNTRPDLPLDGCGKGGVSTDDAVRPSTLACGGGGGFNYLMHFLNATGASRRSYPRPRADRLHSTALYSSMYISLHLMHKLSTTAPPLLKVAPLAPHAPP